MGIADVRAAFNAAAGDALHLNDMRLRYAAGGFGQRQVLELLGRHRDGSPFDVTSAPFAGEPGQRAEEIARDLIRAHTGATPAEDTTMSAPIILGLAGSIGKALEDVKNLAGDAAKELQAAVDELRDEVAGVTTAAAEIRAATAQVRGALAAGSNGGPSLTDQPKGS